MLCRSLRPVAAALACLLAALGCDNGAGPGDKATLALFADVSGTAVATVVVDVTAPDIPAPLVFNIPVANGVASGSITVPSGSARSIGMRAYDAAGVETHSGSTVVNIQPGTDPTVTIVLQPLTGDLPISVTLGSITIAVSPPVLTLTVGGATGQLRATITDWNGGPLSGSVQWATHDPGIATVDNNGVVTAAGIGTTTVVATFQGAAGRATITVTP
jgi:hypothetical protein